MATINPYLNFNGNAEEAFNFYKAVFGGEFAVLQRYREMPGDEKVSESQKEKILHVALPIGKDDVLMGSDAPEQMEHVNFGNNFHISISVDGKEEAQRVFEGLSKGGKVQMPLADAFWGAYFGMVADKFRVQWMVSYTYKK
ncbi:VOC family protein [Candidatus Micrarchaeota archaeon]|nr:VOC family protein [Candidatus Micrarchaeota archaeon]